MLVTIYESINQPTPQIQNELSWIN
jgi:hypothetical protein